MSATTNILEKRIYDKWIPRLKTHYEAKGLNVSESKLRKIAKMCHTRAKWDTLKNPQRVNESATYQTLTNTPGRGAFSLGNNPASGAADVTKGSGEVFDRLFSVFVDAAATTFGMDLLPVLTMSKSNIVIFVAEPIYAAGKMDATAEADKPLLFKVKLTQTGTAPVLTVGTTYIFKTAASAGQNIIDVKYVGKDRINGDAIFQLSTQYDNTGGGGTNFKVLTLASQLGTSGAGIYASAGNFWGPDATKIDYVSGYLNVIQGFGGAGATDAGTWYANRGTGVGYNTPMSRETGEKTYYRSMGIRNWHRNFSAETFHTDIAFTVEQIQDYKMDHDMEATTFGDTILQDQLSQWMNEHILGTIFANGWTNHYQMNQINSSFNMNAALSTSAGTAFAFTGNDGVTAQSIAGAPGAIPASGAVSENLSSLQRRVITRMTFGTAVVKTRCRVSRGDHSVHNAKFSSAIKDVRGYSAATFPSDINDNGVAHYGEFNGIQLYEDTLADLTDPRVSVFAKGKEDTTGLKMCSYLLSEKIETISEGTMANKQALKSRYTVAGVGSNPQLNYLTFCIEETNGYRIV